MFRFFLLALAIKHVRAIISMLGSVGIKKFSSLVQNILYYTILYYTIGYTIYTGYL
jgi:hypothetical protein